jgi:hypothetical protein
MEGHLAGGQRLKEIPYVKLRATCDTNTKVWNMKVSEFLQELKYPIPRWWNLGGVGAFIKGVHYQVDRMAISDCEHLYQTPFQRVIIRLLCAIVVIGIKSW